MVVAFASWFANIAVYVYSVYFFYSSYRFRSF